MNDNYTKVPESKLIILYMFATISSKLSELQAIKYLTTNKWANYFDVKQHLCDLSSSNLLSVQDTPNGRYYAITDSGRESIEIFHKEILFSVRKSIDAFCLDNDDTIRLESGLFSDYIKLSDDEYRVNLKVLDDLRTSFELNIIVYSKREAEMLMNNWVTRATDIYKYTYASLIKE
jgi:hypothetical protein